MVIPYFTSLLIKKLARGDSSAQTGFDAQIRKILHNKKTDILLVQLDYDKEDLFDAGGVEGKGAGAG